MDVAEVVHHWLEAAEEDWKVARHLLEAGDYPYALYFGHLCLEKLLKALVVQQTRSHAPYTHNLLRLVEVGGLTLTPEREEVLRRVTAYNLNIRYPTSVGELRRRFTKEYVEREWGAIKEIQGWLKSQVTS
ncbi:MAG: HEPN domain-containing protein [Dehalococcoidia bacterium]